MTLKCKEILEKHAKKVNIELSDYLKSANLPEIASRYGLASFDDVLANIGYGKVTANQVLAKIVGEREWHKRQLELKHQIQQKKTAAKPNGHAGIGVKGIEHPLVRIARCCTPVPGDPIVGYITRGRGVSVHRADCPNIASLAQSPERQIDVYWESDIARSYAVDLEVEALDRKQLLAEVIEAISETGTNLDAINARTTKNRFAVIHVTVTINNVEHMDKVIEAISRVNGVIHVYRANPT